MSARVRERRAAIARLVASAEVEATEGASYVIVFIGGLSQPVHHDVDGFVQRPSFAVRVNATKVALAYRSLRPRQIMTGGLARVGGVIAIYPRSLSYLDGI